MNNNELSIACSAPAPDRLPHGVLIPIRGWPMEPACRLDEALGGWIRRAMASGVTWRNAVWAAVANGVLESATDFLERATGEVVSEDISPNELRAELAQVLLDTPPLGIIEAAFGTCPESFRGALAKIGPEPLRTSEEYLDLYRTFSSADPDSRRRRKVIEQLAELDSDRLEVVSLLDPAIITPMIAVRLRTPDAARSFNVLLATIRRVCSTATNDAIRSSIDNCPRWRGHAAWAHGWLARADLPSTSSGLKVDDPEIEIATPAGAQRLGSEFRNCLGQRELRLASGVWGVLIWRAAGLIITTTKLIDGAWMMTGVHRHGNAPTSREDVLRAAAKLEPLGLRCPIPALPPEGFERARFGLGGDLFEFDLDDF